MTLKALSAIIIIIELQKLSKGFNTTESFDEFTHSSSLNRSSMIMMLIFTDLVDDIIALFRTSY
jgi:hypothetical protein